MPDLGSLILRNVKGSPLTFTEGDNNIQYAALQSQSVSYTTHYFQSNSLILSRSNGGGIEIKDLGTFTASYAMNAKTASYAVTNNILNTTYSNFVTNSFTKLLSTNDSYPTPGTNPVGTFIYTGSIDFTKGVGNNVTASFRLPTVFYDDITLSGSTTNVDGNFQVVTGDDYLNGIRIYRGEEPGVGFTQFLALNFANGNGNIVAFDPQYDNPRYHFRLSGSTVNRALLSVEKPGTTPQLVFGGTWFTAGDEATTYTSYFSGSAVFLAGATGSLRGTASGNFASASISSNIITFFNGYNQSAGTLNLANSTSQNLQSVTTVGNSTTSSVNIGASSNSSSLSSVAFGSGSKAIGSYSFTNGNSVSASGTYSHAEGGSSIALGNYSHAEGISTLSSGLSSHSEGLYSTASGDYSHVEGQSNIALGVGSHAEGQYVTSSANYSHAEGYQTTTIGLYSHTEGYQTTAIGVTAHAEGEGTTAKGVGSHAEGYYTTTEGNASHAEGYQTRTFRAGGATTDAQHAEGFQTSAVGIHSHAEGDRTVTSTNAQFSHSEGYQTTTIGSWSHVEGQQTTTIGLSSHAEGTGSIAIGNYSHAEGESTTTKNQSSHAAGYKSIASANYQFVVGHGNIEQTTSPNTVGYRPFIVGAGNITGPQTNLLEVVITKVNGGSLNDGTIVLPRVSSSMNFPNSASAAAGGVPLGGIYRNGQALMIRI